MTNLFSPDPVDDAELAAQCWADHNGYVGRRRAVEPDTGWCTDPIGHHDAWRGSELRVWEESRGIKRATDPCPQCGRRVP